MPGARCSAISTTFATRPRTPREQAEHHFSKISSPSTARERAFEERDAIKAVQDEKTQRLREARLARDGQKPKRP
ncbi:hypothetical protein [Paracoccus yeei]|uniref:Uncharacterized protein n=2 Tax=Paracoccus yeei TaxID=147645 RepID=A0A2D2C6W3_9RHOB|nr:hypothetical protein [Paracoccus yeei]ATQ58252.1 hypothetical protein PYTT13_20690 [Paracoccus yeei]